MRWQQLPQNLMNRILCLLPKTTKTLILHTEAFSLKVQKKSEKTRPLVLPDQEHVWEACQALRQSYSFGLLHWRQKIEVLPCAFPPGYIPMTTCQWQGRKECQEGLLDSDKIWTECIGRYVGQVGTKSRNPRFLWPTSWGCTTKCFQALDHSV